MAGKRRRQIRPKFYIFLGSVVAVVIVILFFVFNINTAVVKQGTIPFEKQVPVVVVRDEQVVTAQNYGKANYIASGGDRVEAEAPVMEVYKWGYNEKVMNDLIDYQTKIEQYQQNGLDDGQVTELNAQITQKTADIKSIVVGSTEGNLIAAERELKALMAQKRQYLRDTVQADQQLNEFYAQEDEIAGRVSNWSQVLTAPAAGVISYYFDGAEKTLNAANVEKIKSEDIIDILKGTMGKQGGAASDEAEKPVYRLVNNFKWYLLVYSEKEIPEFANGKVFSIAFDDYITRQYDGTVMGTVEEGNSFIYTIEINDDIGELLNVRRTDAKVFTQFSGLKVPEKALVKKNDVIGVNVVVGNEKTFVPVNVDIIKNENAIVAPIEPNSPLAENQHVEV
ncbi:MAG: HlyD family efflux transporter periplasmic adaptor subunit [Christensenella sp.]